MHFNELRISREWWYFNAVFNDSSSQLKDWSIAVSFNHMARGDLLGTNKPDLLVVSVLGNNSETYGGMTNKEHYLGILKEGTLIAGSPGVKIQFEDSWAEGSYPRWHVHAEDSDIDTAHEIVVDFDYTARSLPVWVLGSRAFDKSESEVANYVLLGCDVSGTVTIDGQTYTVKGTGSHEHSWTPNAITRLAIGGWDWFSLTLDNGWNIYAANYLPSPQTVSGALSKLDPFGTLLITTYRGETITELKDVNLKITKKDEKVFPLVKLPPAFSIKADPSIDPLYVISQALLYGTTLTLIRFPFPLENTRTVSSAITWAPGTVFTGGLLTGRTVIATVSVSLWGPPAPVLPRSLVVNLILAPPVKLAGGANCSPFRPALTAANVPVKVMVTSAVPSPAVKLSPAVPPRVRIPFVAASVTFTGLLPTSTSLTLIRFPLPLENTRTVFLAITWAPGTVFTGALLTGVTVMATVSVSLWGPAGARVPQVVSRNRQAGGAVEVGRRREP